MFLLYNDIVVALLLLTAVENNLSGESALLLDHAVDKMSVEGCIRAILFDFYMTSQKRIKSFFNRR